MPHSHQRQNMFLSCFVKHGSSFTEFKSSTLKIKVSDYLSPHLSDRQTRWLRRRQNHNIVFFITGVKSFHFTCPYKWSVYLFLFILGGKVGQATTDKKKRFFAWQSLKSRHTFTLLHSHYYNLTSILGHVLRM